MLYCMMYLFTIVPHPHGHWQPQELLGNLPRNTSRNLPRTASIRGDLTDVSATRTPPESSCVVVAETSVRSPP